MILHLLTDDKFADYAISQFSFQEIRSDFVLVPSNNAIKLVKQIDKCTIIGQHTPEFDKLLKRLNNYTGIIFHGLFWGSWQIPILQHVPNYVKVGWYFWGGEIYSRHEIYDSFLAPITKFFNKLHQILKQKSQNDSCELPLSLFNRIDYCLTSIYEEFDYAKQFTGASFKHLWYTCYSLEDTIGPLMNKTSDGNNIMLGNSAAIKNNHLDVIWTLLKIGLQRDIKNDDRKIIIPLGYGDLWIRNLIIRIGRLLFGNRMQAIISFMPLNEYNSLMLSCSTMILGYTQPAAQGNIITALWLGMRVYISEKNLSYKYFKRIGVKIFSIESDMRIYHFTPLSEEERTVNRRVLMEWYSKEKVMKAVQNVLNALQ